MMMEEKRLTEIASRIRQHLSDGSIKTNQQEEFVEFFISNAEKSLNSANALFDLSTDKDIQQKTGYHNFDGFL